VTGLAANEQQGDLQTQQHGEACDVTLAPFGSRINRATQAPVAYSETAECVAED